MTTPAYLELGAFFLVMLLMVKPLGAYMARVYQGEPTLPGRVLRPFERFLYRLLGTQPDETMDWKTYARCVPGLQPARTAWPSMRSSDCRPCFR